MSTQHHHADTQQVLNRLSRAIGHLQSVRRMVEDGRDCSEVLIQLAAVRAALSSTSKLIVHDHMQHCIAEAIETGDREAIDDFIRALDQLLK